MAWTFYDAFAGGSEYCPKARKRVDIHGPFPCKRWIKSPTDPKRHKFTYRYRAPQGLGPRSSDRDMERKAVTYARWLAARDGVALPEGSATAVWATTAGGSDRITCVVFAGSFPRVRIDLPNWDWTPAPYTEEHDVTDCPSIAPIAPAMAHTRELELA